MNASFFCTPRATLLTCSLTLACLLLAACRSEAKKTLPIAITTNDEQSDTVVPAIEAALNLDATTAGSGLNDVTYFLNRWNGVQAATEDWKPDELVERLPRPLRDAVGEAELTRTTFEQQDARYLQESAWLRDLSTWLSRSEPDAALTKWARARTPAMSRESLRKLLLSELLFDWTVRNIQLTPLLPYPTDTMLSAADGPSGANSVKKPPYVLGYPGPGYMRQPWQILLDGQGDAWERLRIFTLLCRHQEIEVVVLATYDIKISPRPQPWLAAVVLDNDLALFDTALGLPLPIPDQDGIVFWSELQKQPQWLSALDIDAQTKYPVQAAQLPSVVALIDAAPQALSRRMAAIEAQLVGEQRLSLSVHPSELASTLRSLPGINSVNLWTVPWEADLFAATLRRYQTEETPVYLIPRVIEESLFWDRTPLFTGRLQQVRGQFAKQDDLKGAKGHYLEARPPDDLIERIVTDRQFQESQGLIKSKFESDTNWNNKLRLMQAKMKETKAAASYWLGLVHYESQQYDVAAEWLRIRTLEASRESRWAPGARYNLARCYEKLGRSVDARVIYLEDQSPQRHGNLLRARRLAQLDKP
ncbi:MAG: tetratricopeptide repeat protein [Planctomycetota bacterium]